MSSNPTAAAAKPRYDIHSLAVIDSMTPSALALLAQNAIAAAKANGSSLFTSFLLFYTSSK